MATYKTLIKPEDLTKAKKYLSERIKIDETGCHVWLKAINKQGYGIGNWKRHPYVAHRLSYAIANNGIIGLTNERGNKLVVRHYAICTRSCCNIDHLELGTHKDNANDMIEKGNAPIGENHPNASISEETAKLIIASKHPKGHVLYQTRSERANVFNTSESTVAHIDMGSSWKHIPRKFNTLIKKKERVIKTQRHGRVHEECARLIIASKKHRYDPAYLTTKERAAMFGVCSATISNIDHGHRWQCLPRPKLVEFNKPEFTWTAETAKKAFEEVKKQCKYATDGNKYTGTICLEWQGGLKSGRPFISISCRAMFAYTFSCEFGSGRIKMENEHVRHLCNNKMCCEPTHLEFGCAKDNKMDALFFGESTAFKLNYELAEEIRHQFKNGIKTIEQLAVEYNVEDTTVRSVLNYKSWVA